MAEQASYPAIRFVLQYGKLISWLAGSAIVALGLWCGFSGMGWLLGLSGILAGLPVFLMLQALSELMQIVSETLLPPE